MRNRFAPYVAGTALYVGIVSIIGFIALVLFFALEAPSVNTNPNGFHFWGFLSDVAGPLTMIPLVYVMVALHRVEQAQSPTLSRVALLVGVIGALGVTVLQILLIVKVLTFEQEVGPVVLAMALVGGWLVLASYLGQVQHVLPAGLAWLGIATGIAQALYVVLFPVMGGAGFYDQLGSNIPLMAITSVIFLLSYIGFPIWAIWFARAWSSTRAQSNVEAAYAG